MLLRSQGPYISHLNLIINITYGSNNVSIHPIYIFLKGLNLNLLIPYKIKSLYLKKKAARVIILKEARLKIIYNILRAFNSSKST